jgi:C-terminal processing protease CtpA/Prc
MDWRQTMMKKLWFITLIMILLAGCIPAKNSVKQEDIHTDIEAVEFNNEIVESETIIQHLYVLGKVWGFLKYYHPNVAKGKFNWDAELFKFLPKVLESTTSKERDVVLTEWIDNLGTFEEGKNQKPGKDVIMEPDLVWISELNLEESLSSKLSKLIHAKRPNEQQYVKLAEYVKNPIFNEEAYDSMNYDNDGYNLLALYRYWNIIEYFFPYKNLIEEDWDAVLQEFIPKYLASSTELDYKLASLELIGRVHDSHANMYSEEPKLEQFWGENSAPLRLTFVENKPVVTGYYDEEFGKMTGLINGDVITKINDKPVEEILQEKLKYIPASNHATKFRDIAPKLLRTNEDKIAIEFERDGKTKQAVLETYLLAVLGNPNSIVPQIDKEGFQLLESNIAYLYIGELFNTDLPDIMAKVQNTEGLIIDIRGYPKDNVLYPLAEYLLPEKAIFTKLSAGSLEMPGLFKNNIELEAGIDNKDFYNGKVIILVNEQTQSAAEFDALAFRQSPGAIVMGSTTAGADGDISFIVLPGGIQTAISGIGVYNPDGSDTQRVGIIPDITVTPTIEGIQKNKDEVLEKAIRLIKGETKE